MIQKTDVFTSVKIDLTRMIIQVRNLLKSVDILDMIQLKNEIVFMVSNQRLPFFLELLHCGWFLPSLGIL